MVTSTFGIVMIILAGLVALAGLEGFFVYAAMSPTWKTGRGASTEGLYEAPAPGTTPGRAIVAGQEAAVTAESRVPAGAAS